MSGIGGAGRTSGATATKKMKMMQSIREIVGSNFSDEEIHAVLKECNLDPSEAVHRLLNQDTFHKVKSRREKKKEIKDNTESRPRAVNASSNRGGRGSNDNPGRARVPQVSSSESGGLRSKPAPKKENGPNASTSSSERGFIGESVVAKNSASPSDLSTTIDAISSQYSSGIQRPWQGVSGPRTLADIVKMGRPLEKTNESYASYVNSSRVQQPESFHISSESTYVSHSDWPAVHSSNAEESMSLGLHVEGNDSVNTQVVESVRSISALERQATEEASLDHGHDVFNETASSFQRLNLLDESLSKEDNDRMGVIFPNTLQITSVDCSHLSFGSFVSSAGSSFPKSEKSGSPSPDHSESRSSEEWKPSSNDECYEMPSLFHHDPIRSNSVQEISQVQNLASLRGIMQEAYSSSLSRNDLASTSQPLREFDFLYSRLLAAESTPSISMLEFEKKMLRDLPAAPRQAHSLSSLSLDYYNHRPPSFYEPAFGGFESYYDHQPSTYQSLYRGGIWRQELATGGGGGSNMNLLSALSAAGPEELWRHY